MMLKPLVTGIYRCAGLALLAVLVAAPGARADSRIEKNLKLDPGGKFVLDSDAGSVTLMGSSERGANVVITSNRDDLQDLLEFNFEDGPNTARVTAKRRHHFNWHNFSVHFEIRVPTQTQLDLHTGGGGVRVASIHGDSELNTSGGSMEVTELEGRLHAETSGGGVRLRDINGEARVGTSGGNIEADNVKGSLRAETSGGPIRAERIGGDLYAETSGGSIHVEGVAGHLVAKTSGGSVEVVFDKGNGRGGEVETSGGSIRVAVDPKVNLTFDASASGGGVTVDELPITVQGRISSSSLHGNLGSGGENLRLHTDGGSIHIRAL
jgi:DUF4097 and DUF4098 domain-containing protein YvlB